MFTALADAVPTLLGVLAFISLASDPAAPCGPESRHRAETLGEHCRAVANHCWEIARLITRRTDGGTP
ncbi:hypothetical protein GTY62_38895 [Streptomyces sp. SID724]|uniref:hypothetical protein n=1 Tax=Streptomyces sp. SID724 TaxID=2690324 RepID=UPI0013618030|nr:hypothetical protein [Streptomyces sp. SID724]